MKKGFIYLQRNIIDWKWYKNETVKNVFIHLLLKANYSEKEWEELIIKRGSFVTGLKKLSLELDISQNKIRLALQKLKRTNDISIKTTNKYSIITINNYDSYQPINKSKSETNQKQEINKKQSNQKENTNREQTENKPTTTTNKEENNKNNLINNNKEKIKESNFNFPNDISKNLKSKILKFIEYRENIGKPYKSQMSIDALIQDLKTVDEEIAIKQINKTIASGWVGVFNLKGLKNRENDKYEPIQQKSSTENKLTW